MSKSGRKGHDKIVRAETRLARRAARLDRREEQRLADMTRRLDEARLLALDPDQAGNEALVRQQVWPRRRALLVINSKSGPKRDSLLRTREIVDLLGAFNIQTEVRIKLSKSQARREARRAAADGFPIVIAAGGDGTVEAVARGLVGTSSALGILPLGTYNNVAACLGVPVDLAGACALIASYDARPIDVGEVQAAGMGKPRMFLEMATVGLGAMLTPLGQDFEKGRFTDAARTLPMVMNMSPAGMVLRLENDSQPIWGHSLLLTVNNAPRSGAALSLAPDARMDDSLLDLILYEGLAQGDLAARFLEMRNGTHVHDPQVRHIRALAVDVHTTQPMAVAADSKLVGVTPARFTVRAGALRAIVGHGPGLSRPATSTVPLPSLVQAVQEPPVAPSADPPLAVVSQHVLVTTRLADLTRLATPAVAALAGAAALPLFKALAQRFDRQRRSR